MWTAILGQACASEQAVKVSLGTDVPKVWTADQHVYVKGSLGVSSSRLNALEKWMDQNAPNWTVVLMVNARQESFSEAGGRIQYPESTQLHLPCPRRRVLRHRTIAR
jgi:hypothetical protein